MIVVAAAAATAAHCYSMVQATRNFTFLVPNPNALNAVSQQGQACNSEHIHQNPTNTVLKKVAL